MSYLPTRSNKLFHDATGFLIVVGMVMGCVSPGFSQDLGLPATGSPEPAGLSHATQQVERPTLINRGTPTLSSLGKMENPLFPQMAQLHSLGRYGTLFHSTQGNIPQAVHSTYGEISLVLNATVERNLHYFRDVIPERFQECLDRFSHYQPVVQPIFEEFQLPKELMYLSLVESGFNPRAYSRAHAAGPWQFIKPTGRLYGLHINWYVDERRDPIKSTVAAAHHLRDLYDQFGSWPLALSAYNAGPGKISRAIRKSRTRDYWKIRKTWYIRRETKEYVPRFIAATLIALDPTLYGFSENPIQPHRIDEVLVTKRVHLRSVAQTTGIPLQELRQLNPELRRNIIPAQSQGYYLKVPKGKRELVARHQHQFKLWTQPPPPPSRWYRVRWGDSLSVIAKRFGMSVRSLKELNHRSGNRVFVGNRLRVRKGQSPIHHSVKWYTIAPGDTLSVIAQRFGITVRTLARMNPHVSGTRIHAGSTLRVKGNPSPAKNGKHWYKVRTGDSLWRIARQFSVTVTDLKILNNLTSSFIKVGHLLLISP